MVVAHRYKKPELSIIIPTRNEAHFLPIVLRCIKQSSYQKYEIIVADNNSQDKTREIARTAGARICKGGLPGVGRNRGAAQARADTLLFLDADVRFGPQFLSRSMSAFRKRKLSCASVCSVPYSTHPMDHAVWAFFNVLAWVTQRFDPNACGYCIFVNRKAFEKVGGFNERLSLGEDLALVRAIRNFGILPAIVRPSVRRLRKNGRIRTLATVIRMWLLRGGGAAKYSFLNYDEKIARKEKSFGDYFNSSRK